MDKKIKIKINNKAANIFFCFKSYTGLKKAAFTGRGKFKVSYRSC